MTESSEETKAARAETAMPPILQLDHLCKQYPTKDGPLTVLEPTSLTMQVTELVSIVGPSGCGKSTLLHIVGGLLPPTAGQVLLDGEEVFGPGGVPERPDLRDDGASGASEGGDRCAVRARPGRGAADVAGVLPHPRTGVRAADGGMPGRHRPRVDAAKEGKEPGPSPLAAWRGGWNPSRHCVPSLPKREGAEKCRSRTSVGGVASDPDAPEKALQKPASPTPEPSAPSRFGREGTQCREGSK